MNKIQSRERRASECNTLAVDRRVDEHAGTVENWSGPGLSDDPSRLEPSIPVRPVIEPQEWKFQQIGSAHYPVAAAGKPGAAHRKQPLGAKPLHLQLRPSAIAVANGEVDILARKVDALVARGNAEVDSRMALGEPAKPTDEPLRREIRRHADGEHTGLLPLRQTLSTERDLVERVANDCEILAARLGDDEPLALAIKKLKPELGLERFDLLAHGARRHEQLLSSAREALTTRHGLKSLDGIERREAARHPPFYQKSSRRRNSQ